MNVTPSPRPIEKRCLLVGEGREEVRFFDALFKHLAIEDVQVEECGGKAGLAKYLRAQLVRPGFDSLARLVVVQDADSDPVGRFQSICDTIRSCGLTPPPEHAKLSDGKLSVGVFVMPGGKRSGMLETLCMESVSGDAAIPCVDDFLQCVKGRCGYSPEPFDKARIHSWLASRQKPDRRLGEAAEAGAWPWTHPAFAELIAFMRQF